MPTSETSPSVIHFRQAGVPLSVSVTRSMCRSQPPEQAHPWTCQLNSTSTRRKCQRRIRRSLLHHPRLEYQVERRAVCADTGRSHSVAYVDLGSTSNRSTDWLPSDRIPTIGRGLNVWIPAGVRPFHQGSQHGNTGWSASGRERIFLRNPCVPDSVGGLYDGALSCGIPLGPRRHAHACGLDVGSQWKRGSNWTGRTTECNPQTNW